jgi:non-specific serine/threonine protein kinase
VLRDEHDPRGIASTLIALALIAGEGGDHPRAVALYRESLPLWEALAMDEGLGAWLAGVATLAVACDRPVQAARLFGAAAELAECTGVTFHLPERIAYDRAVLRMRDMVSEASVAVAWEDGRALPRDQVVARATDLLDSLDAPEDTAPRDFGLTSRERDVLRLLATGRTDREIAEALFVSPRTIQSHVAHIRMKLAVGSRPEAAALAIRYDLV